MDLFISTSFSKVKIIMASDNNLEKRALFTELNKHLLLPKLLDVLNIDLKQVKKIFVDYGPGGTSSIRTSLSFINTVSFLLKIDVYAISTLELLTLAGTFLLKDKILITIKTLNKRYWIAYFDSKTQTVKYNVIDKSELIDIISKKEYIVISSDNSFEIKNQRYYWINELDEFYYYFFKNRYNFLNYFTVYRYPSVVLSFEEIHKNKV